MARVICFTKSWKLFDQVSGLSNQTECELGVHETKKKLNVLYIAFEPDRSLLTKISLAFSLAQIKCGTRSSLHWATISKILYYDNLMSYVTTAYKDWRV